MSITPHPKEKELIDLTSKGDKRAFSALFEAYHKPLGRYVYKMTESLETTEEIVQDVFIKIWIKKEQLNEINSLSNYLFILSRNLVLNYLRKQSRYQIHFQAWDNTKELEVAQLQEEDSYEHLREVVEKAIESLSEQQKRIYKLCKLERLKYEEVAAKLNLSIETIRKHMYLASKTIKLYVKQHNEEAIILLMLLPFSYF